MFTTSVTEAEIFYGVELLTKGRRRDGLMAVAEAIFADDFYGRILDFDSQAARAYSRIATLRRALGKPISHPDAQIAAIVSAATGHPRHPQHRRLRKLRHSRG